MNEGTETFTIFFGTTQIGSSVTVNVLNGVANASYNLPAGLAVGSYTIQDFFSGTSHYASITDSSHSLVIIIASSTTVASTATATYNGTASQLVTLNADDHEPRQAL